MEKREHEAGGQHDEIRCATCGYFLCQRILVEGKSVLKFVCRSCKTRLIVTISPEAVAVGQV